MRIAERARDEPAGNDECGDRAARQIAAGDVERAAPHQQRDRAEHQHDHDRGHDRAQQDTALGGRESALHRFLEPPGFASFLVERLHHAQSAEHLGHHRPDVGDPVLAGARDRPDLPPEAHDRQHDQGYRDHQPQRQQRCQCREVDYSADTHDDVAQRHRDRGPDDLLDQRGVRGHPRRDFLGAVSLEEARLEPQQVLLHAKPDVRDHPLAQPGDQVEAHRGAKPEHDHVEQQELEPAADVRRIAARGEPAIDHHAEPRRNGERGQARSPSARTASRSPGRGSAARRSTPCAAARGCGAAASTARNRRSAEYRWSWRALRRITIRAEAARLTTRARRSGKRRRAVRVVRRNWRCCIAKFPDGRHL